MDNTGGSAEERNETSFLRDSQAESGAGVGAVGKKNALGQCSDFSRSYTLAVP